jgi:hypothetical protein
MDHAWERALKRTNACAVSVFAASASSLLYLFLP